MGCPDPRCCCDVCLEDRLKCHKCCKCVPKAMCFHFVPDYEDDCGERFEFAERTTTDDSDAVYSAMGVTVSLIYDEYEKRCYWLVEYPDDYGYPVEDEYDVRGEYGVGCKCPSFSVPVDDEDCPGSIEITCYDGMEKVEFFDQRDVDPEYRDEDRPCVDWYCGKCRCACKTLCVRLSIDGYVSDEEWDWDGGGWGDIRLEREEPDEYGEGGGGCIAVYGDYDEFDPIPVGDCGNEIVLAFVNEYTGDSVRATCKKCSCEEPRVVIPCCPENTLPRRLFGVIQDDGTSYPCHCDPVEFEMNWEDNLDEFLDDVPCQVCAMCPSDPEGGEGAGITSGWVATGVFWCDQGPFMLIVVPCRSGADAGIPPPGFVPVQLCFVHEVTGATLIDIGAGGTLMSDTLCEELLIIPGVECIGGSEGEGGLIVITS